jgi:hypothetical protein
MLLNWQIIRNLVWVLGIHWKQRTWRKLALQLEAGSSFVNKLVVSDPRLPFKELKQWLRKGTGCLWNS